MLVWYLVDIYCKVLGGPNLCWFELPCQKKKKWRIIKQHFTLYQFSFLFYANEGWMMTFVLLELNCGIIHNLKDSVLEFVLFSSADLFLHLHLTIGYANTILLQYINSPHIHPTIRA